MQRFDELPDAEKMERYGRLARKALAGYGLDGDLTYVARGTSMVFRLRTGGASFAVRVCAAGRDHVPLRRELLWLAALGRDTVLTVPEPVLTLEGNLFRSVSMEGVSGTRACAVYRWIDGERREAELTADEVAAMSQLVAGLHRHAETFSWPEELVPGYASPSERALAAAEAACPCLVSPTDRDLICDAVASITESTLALDAQPDVVGIIHGDLRLRKLRLSAESAGVFGFDWCRVGAYLDDLSTLWADLAGRETTQALQQALLDGYQSIRELPLDAANILRAFAALRALEAAAGALVSLRGERRVQGPAIERAAADLRRELKTILPLGSP